MAEEGAIDIPKLRRTVAVLFGLFPVIFAAALFISAGTPDWWQAWLSMATWMVPAASFTAYYLKADPAMIERRMRSKEPEAEQHRIIRFGWIVSIAASILPGFDRRFGWSSVPDAVVRHTLYSSSLLITTFSPVALLFFPMIVARILNEERVLLRDLPGYAEYLRVRRYRHIPGIW